MRAEEILRGKSMFVGQDALDLTYEQYETSMPVGIPSIDTLVKQLKKYQKNIYKRFFPKVFQDTAVFHDYRIPSATAASMYIAFAGDQARAEGYQAYTNYLIFSLLWEQFSCPTFFVTKQFLEAIRHTVIPKDFDLKDFELPFPATVFVFEKGSNFKYKNRPVTYLGVAHPKGEFKTDLGQVAPGRPNSVWDKMCFTTSFLPDHFFAPGIATSGLGKVVQMDPRDFRDLGHKDEMDAYTAVDDAEFTLQLAKIGVALVLAMQSAPELVTKGAYLRRSSQSNPQEYKPSVWTPNILGAKYRTVREPGDGTHSSPRAHWRVGHFRRTRIGSIRCSTMNCKHPPSAHVKGEVCQIVECECTRYSPSWTYRKDWIKPVLVNALAY